MAGGSLTSPSELMFTLIICFLRLLIQWGAHLTVFTILSFRDQLCHPSLSPLVSMVMST